jgi:hypothetical protein
MEGRFVRCGTLRSTGCTYVGSLCSVQAVWRTGMGSTNEQTRRQAYRHIDRQTASQEEGERRVEHVTVAVWGRRSGGQ